MTLKKLISASAIAALALFGFNANAESVDANTARMAAKSFFNQNVAVKGNLRAAANADVMLTHAEASSVEGNAYYVFNIDGGGWVIIAGDDRAKQVLAYGETGSIDMNSMPENMKGYMDRYKDQIETIQRFNGKTEPMKAPKRRTPVAPLLKSVNWSQHNPFYNQCYFNGSYCSVGCAGLGMAQILNYWEYPKECAGLDPYTPSWNLSVPRLPATTFDYDKILDCYLVWEGSTLVWADGVTDENKDEVAKLCRYAAQASEVNFSPNGSGSNVTKQYKGFLKLGYSSDAKLLGIEAWPTRETWNTWDYTDDQWVDSMYKQLEARHPIPYSSEGFVDGHTFVVDGFDAEGLFHVSWGWNGRGDGYFQFGAFNVTVAGEYMEYNDALFMVIDLIPYEGYVIPGSTSYDLGDVNHDGDVDVNDVTTMISYILGDNPTPFYIEQANVDGDGEGAIDVGDVTALIAIILNAD